MTEAYIGLNKAHQQFVQKMTNEKVFVYLIMENKDSLFASFQEKIDDARQRSIKMGSCEFSIGIITKVISPTQLKGITIRPNESTLIVEDFAQFESQVYGKAFAEIHRIFVDYQIDLYREIVQKCPSMQERDNLSYKGPRQDAFEEIGLRILPGKDIGGSTSKDLETRLHALECTRHLIEHSSGIVDERFLKLNPGTPLSIGQRIPVGPEQIGEAIALIETLAEDLNKRAVQKYHLG